MSLQSYLARAALADKEKDFSDYFAQGSQFVTDLQERERKNRARGMLTGSVDDYSLENLSKIASLDPELAKSLMSIRSAEATADYYKGGGRSAQLTPAQAVKQKLDKIKTTRASELNEVGAAGLRSYMNDRFGHLTKSTGWLFGDDVSLLEGEDLSTKPKVRRFIMTHKNELFPEGEPKPNALKEEIKAALSSWDTAVDLGAKNLLYNESDIKGETSRSTSEDRPYTSRELFGDSNASAKASLLPMTQDQEQANAQELVTQLTRIKNSVNGDREKFLKIALPLVERLEGRIRMTYKGQPELIEKYVRSMNAIANSFYESP